MLTSSEKYWVLFLQIIKLLADHIESVEVWFQALLNKAGAFQFCPFSWDMGLIPKPWPSGFHGKPGVFPKHWWESNSKLYLSSIRVAAKISVPLLFFSLPAAVFPWGILASSTHVEGFEKLVHRFGGSPLCLFLFWNFFPSLPGAMATATCQEAWEM